MCGIAGYVRSDPAAPAPVETVRDMTAVLVHRGPDAGGLTGIGPAALGHRRLSILDPEGGRQPFVSSDGRVALTFNGEIYNYRELKAGLEARGRTFRTRSDTEVLLQSYLEWGTDCLERLRGMFAFGIYDDRDRSLFLARDRLGIKPVYYALRPEGMLFGSELKAILAANAVPRDIDPHAVLDYLSVRHVPAPRTIFRSVAKLPPAHALLFRNGRSRVWRYWDLEFRPDEGAPAKEWRERLLEKLTEAVRLRMAADVPLGAFLSGGVDSAGIVALLSGLSADPVRTSTVGFSEAAYDELGAARTTAKHLGTDHREYVTRPGAAEAMRFLAWHYDEPFGDSSAVPTFYVSRMTRQRVKVALSGDGADESFAGYRRHRFDHLENRLRDGIPSLLRALLVRPAAAAWPAWGCLPRPLRAKTLLRNLAGSPEEAYFRSLGARAGLDKRELLSAGLRSAVGDYDPADRFRDLHRRAPAPDAIGKALYVDTMTWLPGDILTKVDRASMANGLEVRIPFLDHEVIELAARIPSRLKLAGGRGKAILKDALADRLPAQVLRRRKHGFAMPVKEWLRTDLKESAREWLLGASSSVGGLFRREAVRRLWDRHQRGRRDESDMLWLLLAFESWHRTFAGRSIDSPGRAAEDLPVDSIASAPGVAAGTVAGVRR